MLRKALLAALAVYLAAVVASNAARWLRDLHLPAEPPLPPGMQRLAVAAERGGAAEAPASPAGRPGDFSRDLSLAVAGWGHGEVGRLPVLLFHGSPGSHRDFRRLGPALGEERRVYAPDLPGFGASSRRVPDYSIVAHSGYAVQMMDELGIEQAHVVGFSMGGGVALSLYQRAPERVASISLVAAIGVQELELLGQYRLNHLIHGLQLGAIETALVALPHFGRLDEAFLSREYARNFFDTDQRPLRGVLREMEAPLLIVHGREDPLVPVAAAREHHRIVPHSELVELDTSHFFLFSGRPDVAPFLDDFFDRVEEGTAPRRGDASEERRVAAEIPFSSTELPAASGFGLGVVMALLALATLVSEDLTSIGAGLLVAQGRIGFWPAAVACVLGVYIGDLLLFLAGRALGRPALRVPPLKWWLSEEAVERSSAWFDRQGFWVILLSRFTPGARLPTYFAAGLLRTSIWRFALYFFLAVAIWTPALVALAMVLGRTLLDRLAWLHDNAWGFLAVLVGAVLVLRLLVMPLFTYGGRRRLVGRWRRWTQWEFWPPWLFYPPVVLYVLYRALRHRGLTFTAANPAIPHAGFIGESKAEILRGLAAAGERLPRWKLLPAGPDAEERARQVESFRRGAGLDYPLVLKPDEGQRGSGVAVVRSAAETLAYLEVRDEALVVQEYVPGEEFGVFYLRRPGEEEGEIFSVTEKRLPRVVGDGRRSLEQLILDDPRAVAMADLYLEKAGGRRDEVPVTGEVVQLVELGTHCRGAIFLDGGRHRTAELLAAVEEAVAGFEGFHFGRFDLRTPSAEALQRGEFRILELNGVTSEATHIYDPRHSVTTAWRTLAEQWRLAFEIGEAQRRAGARVSGVSELLDALRGYRRRSRGR